YTFEVGGKSKDGKQIANMSNSYIAADGIEFPYGNKIPLWCFGFLY
ncbi:MAG: AAA family ATPase, partial [Prevotella sp.]|nr:AAA family ATPase [Prevotella sp.]